MRTLLQLTPEFVNRICDLRGNWRPRHREEPRQRCHQPVRHPQRTIHKLFHRDSKESQRLNSERLPLVSNE